MKKTFVLFSVLAVSCAAQQWQFGGAGGFGFTRNLTVQAPAGAATAGFKPGPAMSAFLDQNLYSRISGEMRYTLQLASMKVAGNGTEVTFGAMSHAVHYDLLIFAAPPGSSVRPFVAGGGGVKVYRGTGTETAFLPLTEFAIPTKTQEAKGMLSAGGGLEFRVARRISMRAEFRDYMTPFPKKVLTPGRGASVGGWVHNIVPMLGIGFDLEGR